MHDINHQRQNHTINKKISFIVFAVFDVFSVEGAEEGGLGEVSHTLPSDWDTVAVGDTGASVMVLSSSK